MTALTLTVDGGIARVTLAQPAIRNAFSDAAIAEITAAFLQVGERADVRAVVLAAEGPAFCAGADLNWMRRMADYSRDENRVDAGLLAEMLRIQFRSAPAQNAGPSAASTTARTSARSPTWRKAAVISAIAASLKALRMAG